MVRLTADLVFSSPQFFNAVKQRELDLRGNKIAAIENLGVTEDMFDAIDISDNEVVKLESFPLLKRLTTLLASNNRITRISPHLGAQLPNLRVLVLANNRLANLSDLDPLSSLTKLEALSLLDNVVSKKPKYRLYCVHRLPHLRLLDFRKVKPKERKEALALFGTVEEAEQKKLKQLQKEKEAAKAAEPDKDGKKRSNTFVPGEGLPSATGDGAEGERPAKKPHTEGGEETTREGDGVGGEEGLGKKPPTAEQITAIKAAIATAQTLEEVARLEKALKSGQLPPSTS